MPETAGGWPREWHELVIAEVTSGRRWRTTGPSCPSWTKNCMPGWIPGDAGVGPPPATAKTGARYGFVFVAGKLTRALGEIDASHPGVPAEWIVGWPLMVGDISWGSR